MTTTTATETTASDNVSAVVRMMLAARNEKFDVLVPALGIGRTTTFEKVSGRRRWYAEEVQALAEYFELPVGAFYAGPMRLVRDQNREGLHSRQGVLFGETPDFVPSDFVQEYAQAS